MERKLGIDWEHESESFQGQSLQTNQVQDGYDLLNTGSGSLMDSVRTPIPHSQNHQSGYITQAGRSSINQEELVVAHDFECREDMEALGK